MKNAVQSQKAMYSYGYESKARALNGFAEMFDLPDFEERRAKLVAGLDKESTAVVNLVLRRLKVILGLKEGEKVDLYTREEQEAFAEAWRQLYSKIVQIAPDLFVWDGYALPCKHFESNVFLDGYGFRFLRTLGQIGDDAIIDAGAYIGDSSLMLAPLTSGKVFAFEPMKENFKQLEKTVLLNNLDNVVPVHCALGDNEGTSMMQVGSSGAGATIQNKLPGDILVSELVEVVRLDDFVRSHGISVGLIKTDVEGAEQMLLRGAKETICRDRPILLISIYHNASDFLDIKPMIESWNLGYRFRIYHPPIMSISGETVLIAECDKHRAGHRSRECVCLKSRHIWQICAGAVASVRESISQRNELLKKRDGQLAQREEQLGAAREAIAKRDELLKKRDGQLAQREEQLGTAREAIAKRDGLLKKRDGQLMSANEKKDELRKQKERRDIWLKKRDEKIKELTDVIDRLKGLVL